MGISNRSEILAVLGVVAFLATVLMIVKADGRVGRNEIAIDGALARADKRAETPTAARPRVTAIARSAERVEAFAGTGAEDRWEGGRPPLRYALRAGEGALVAAVEKLGDRHAADNDSASDDDYAFPAIEISAEGVVSMSIPDAPLPSRSSKRALFEGEGPDVAEGDLIALRYDVYSWSTGELIESHWHGSEAGYGYVVGGENSNPLPDYLERAVRGRALGSRIQVVLHRGTPDLPPSFDPRDGYIVIADVDPPEDVHREAFVAAPEFPETEEIPEI